MDKMMDKKPFPLCSPTIKEEFPTKLMNKNEPEISY